MKKNEILAVTGMTGVGKDFLVERANQSHGFPVVNLGTLIGQKLAADRDLMMDTVDPRQIRAAQISAYQEVVENQPLIVTCHAIRPQTEGYGYDLEMEQIFNPSRYIFVAAPGEIIARRIQQRNERGERKSPELPAEEIEQIQRLKLNALEELTGRLGCNLLVIRNTDEDVHISTAMLSEQIENLSMDAY